MSKRKRKLKPKWRVIIPFVLVVILVAYLLFYLIGSLVGWVSKSGDPRNSLYCSSNSIKIADRITKQSYEASLAIGDSFFYGESWVLTSDVYNTIGKTNAYVGKTLKLVNICNNKSSTYLLGDKFDEFVPLGTLAPGVYEVYLINNEIAQRLSANDKLLQQIFTVSASGSTYQVEVIADKEYFSKLDDDKTLAENYLFLQVTKKDLPLAVYDFVIDPGFNDRNDDTQSNDIYRDDKVAKPLFDLANALAEELKKSGYKVLVTRASFEEEMATYGEDGRIERTLQVQAKYYLNLTFNKSSDDTLKGAKLLHSSYSSDALAEALYEQLAKQELVFEQKPLGAAKTTRGFDNEISVREIGGIALQAARFSDYAREANGDFAYTPYGVNGVSISFGYLSNNNDVETLIENYKNIAKALALGLDNYLKRK